MSSGAECFSKQIDVFSGYNVFLSTSFQQKFLGLQSYSDSHSEPTSAKAKHYVANGHLVDGLQASPLLQSIWPEQESPLPLPTHELVSSSQTPDTH